MSINLGFNTKQNLLSVIIEVIFIFVAVILGLVVNELRISYNNNEHTQKALNYIITEITINSNQLENNIPYHTEVRDSLSVMAESIMNSKNNQIKYRDFLQAIPKGFNVPLLESTGWEIINSTEVINNIKLDLSIELSRLYNMQSFIEGKLNKLGENIYISSNNDPNDTDRLIISISFLIDDILA